MLLTLYPPICSIVKQFSLIYFTTLCIPYIQTYVNIMLFSYSGFSAVNSRVTVHEVKNVFPLNSVACDILTVNFVEPF
jgi:hypothetical protein